MPRTWCRALVCVGLLAGCSSGSSGDGTQPAAKPAGSSHTPTVAAPGGDDTKDYDAASLGAVNFAVTGGTPAARAHFTRGLLALDSFWYDAAIKEFSAAIATDPSFPMAYWGLAMSQFKLLWGDDDLTAAKAALSRIPGPETVSVRERAWVYAAVALIKGDVRTSRKNFVAAMEQIHAQFPDDESACFLALALLSSFRPGDPDELAIRKRAGALAAEVFARNPKHPGAAHYLIHAYDTPQLAELALPAARAYAAIAPAAFHARHMPAHIFSRLGMWNEALDSCQAAWDVSIAWAAKEHLSADHHDFHSLTWLVEMNFELGRRGKATAAMTMFSDAVRGGLEHKQRSLFADEVVSYMARTGEWQRVDELLAPLEARAVDAAPSSGTSGASPGAGAAACGAHAAPMPPNPPQDVFEQKAILSARLHAAAMRRDLARTRALLAEMQTLDDRLQPFFAASLPPDAVAKMAQARARAHDALVARARGDEPALLAALNKIAALSDLEIGGEGTTSGSVLHEDIGDTLMRMHKPTEALREYDRVVRDHPGRARSLLGAARAAAQAHDANAARGWYQKLLVQWSNADDDTPELAEVRAGAAP